MFLKAPPRGPSQPYEPDNYDESIINDYGGFTMAEGRGRPGGGGGRGFRGGSPRGVMGGRGGMMGRGGGMGFRDDSGMRRPPPMPPRCVNFH